MQLDEIEPNVEEIEGMNSLQIELMYPEIIEPNEHQTEVMDSLQIEPMHQTEAIDSLQIEGVAEIEENTDEEPAIIERVDRQLVITSAPPEPEEKKTKRKKLMGDAENIPARVTWSKVVNPANNTRSKKNI